MHVCVGEKKFNLLAFLPIALATEGDFIDFPFSSDGKMFMIYNRLISR